MLNNNTHRSDTQTNLTIKINMKFINPLFLQVITALYCTLLTTTNLQAATEHTDIQVNVIHDEYVKIVGTAAGSSRMYSNNDVANWIFPNTVDLGTLGLESNMSGNCALSVSTQNNFKLLHTVSGQRLTRYKLIYESHDFSETNNQGITLPCNFTPTNLQFAPTELVFGNLFPSLLIESGIYRDIVTFVVTTQ